MVHTPLVCRRIRLDAGVLRATFTGLVTGLLRDGVLVAGIVM